MYLIIETYMNSNMSIHNVDSTIIHAPDFTTAKNILRELPTLQSKGSRIVKIVEDDDKGFTYSIRDTDNLDLVIYGRMSNRKAKVLGSNPIFEKLQQVIDYPSEESGRRTEDGYPIEVVCDEFAYKRIVDSYRKALRQIISEEKEV